MAWLPPMENFTIRFLQIRIWRSFPRLEVEESKVIGMAFDKDKSGRDYILHVVCGKSGSFDTASYVLELGAGEDIKIDTRSDIPQAIRGEVKKITKMSEISDDYKTFLRENILPQPVQLQPAGLLKSQSVFPNMNKSFICNLL